MACNSLTTGFDLSCINANPGGVAYMYIGAYTKGAITARPTGNILTTLPSSLTTVYKYELANTANVLTSASALDPNNRSSVHTQTMVAVINSLDADVIEELYQITMGEVWVFVESNDEGKVWLMGAQLGATGTISLSSGTQIADGQNATITLTANEQFPILNLDSSAVTALKGLVD